MKHRIQNLLAGMIAVVTGRWLAVALGASLRLQLLVSLGIAFMLLALAEWSLRLWLERIIAEAHPGELRDAAAAEPELQALLADRSRSNERRDWQWTVHSVTWAVLAVAAPITLLPWWRHGQLQADTPIDALDVSAMAAGVAAYMLVKRQAVRNYRCPACGRAARRLDSPAPRFACASCGVTWRSEP